MLFKVKVFPKNKCLHPSKLNVNVGNQPTTSPNQTLSET